MSYPTGTNVGFLGDEAIATDSAGNVAITAFTSSSGGFARTIKFAATDGAILWQKPAPGPYSGVGRVIAVDSQDNVVVGGALFESTFSTTQANFWIAKYASADGTLLWEAKHPVIGGGASANAIAIDIQDAVVISGFTGTPTGLQPGAVRNRD